jgi:hypothetical protein
MLILQISLKYKFFNFLIEQIFYFFYFLLKQCTFSKLQLKKK